ncbi:hypothetical protein ABZY68_33195 [Streptomyces sp. NPDC006482]|uniref:hypothetical protein n=1 Tax=Streptomyces sp. NPDC006482 TaxID=3154306 RepID=UPI0033B83C02
MGQLRGRVGSWLPLAGTDAVLRSVALQRAVARSALATDGVADCRTRVTGRRPRFSVRIDVTLDPDGTPAAVLPALVAVAERAERALAPHTLRMYQPAGDPMPIRPPRVVRAGAGSAA